MTPDERSIDAMMDSLAGELLTGTAPKISEPRLRQLGIIWSAPLSAAEMRHMCDRVERLIDRLVERWGLEAGEALGQIDTLIKKLRFNPSEAAERAHRRANRAQDALGLDRPAPARPIAVAASPARSW